MVKMCVCVGGGSRHSSVDWRDKDGIESGDIGNICLDVDVGKGQGGGVGVLIHKHTGSNVK